MPTLLAGGGPPSGDAAAGDRAVLGPGAPVRLTDWTEPEPDVVVFKPRSDFYARKRPTLQDVLLIVEVSDSSLSYDRKIKLPRYAAAGISEVWIEDLTRDQLLVYRDPGKDGYLNSLTLRRGDSVSPLAFPDVTFNVSDLLPSENK